MKERLALFLEKESLTRNAFASKIGVQRSNVTHILEGRNKPGFDFIEKLLNAFPHVNAEWLICGRGSMYKQAMMPSLFPELEDKKTEKEKPAIIEEKKTIQEFPFGGTKKEIERIVILYTDKTFDIYTQ